MNFYKGITKKQLIIKEINEMREIQDKKKKIEDLFEKIREKQSIPLEFNVIKQSNINFLLEL